MYKKLAKLFISFTMICTLLPSTTYAAKATTMEEVVTTVDDTDVGTGINQFQFTGWWQAETGISTDYNGTEHWSNKGRWKDTPPSVTLRFKGNKVALFGKKEKVGGIYKAVMDGDEKNAVEIDTYNPTPQTQEQLYVKDGLSEGEHTLTLTVQKKMNAMGGTYENVNVGAVIDYAKVYAMEAVNPDKVYEKVVDDSDSTNGNDMFKIQYKGSGWEAESGFPDLFYKGTDHYSNDAGATYEMRFIGSSIEIIGSKNTAHADYTVSIDGKVAGDALAKLPSGAAQHQKSLFKKEGLSEGEHTLKVARKEGSSGAIQVDALKVNHKAIAPTGIAFENTSLSIEVGMQDKVKAILTPDYATASNIVYAVADPSLATITQEGTITALKSGTTNITATLAGTALSATLALTVLPEGAPLKASVGTIYEHATQDDYNKVLAAGKNTWSDVAWRGDILNSKIDIATKKAIHNAKVSASSFKNGTALIPSSAIEINWLKETMANIGRGNGSAPVKPFPDIIHKSGTIDIDAKKVQSAWIDINVPKDAKPGMYNGTISVSCDELAQPITFAYSFEVIDLAQPDALDTSTEVQIWQHPFAVAAYYGVSDADLFTEKHFQYMRPSLKEYKELGGHDIVANIVEEAWNHQSYTGDPSMVKWIKKKDGTFTYNYDWFDKWVNFNIEEGVLDPAHNIGQIKCYSIVPWGNQITYYDEATNTTKKVNPATGTDQWKAMWKPFLEDFMKHTKAKGWFDITYISMDERGMQDLQNSVDLIQSVKGNDGKAFKISSAFNYSSGTDYSFLDKIDDISVDLAHINNASQDMRKMSEHRKELGLKTTIYTCTGDYPSNYTISNMSDNAWTMWYSLSQNTDGFMRWAWDNWVADPLNNVTYKYWEPGDGWFIYPVEKGTKSDTYFYKTPRYELLKQGVRDINKAKYLMEHSATLKPQIDALVKSLKRPNKGNNGYGSAVAATPADAALTGTEVDRMRKGVMEFSREYVASEAIPVTSIELDKKDVALREGETVGVKATVKPDNATDKQVTWKSADPTIATVDAKGLITGVKAGKTTITVSDSSGKITATVQVEVQAKPIAVTSIELDKKDVALREGETVGVKATVKPDNATDKQVTWKSADPTIATVDAKGLITGVKAGKTTITVSDSSGKITATVQVEVQAKPIAVTSIELDKKDVALKEGETVGVKATVKPDNATDKQVTWKSADPTIATVDAKGLITGVKAGKTTITVSDSSGKITATVQVEVQAKTIPVTAIEVSTQQVTLKPLENIRVQAKVIPDNATDTQLYWHSSDSNIASVQDGKITAVRAGTATIRVATKDGSIYRDIQVIVKDTSTAIDTTITLKNLDGSIEVVGNLDPNTKLLTKTLSVDNIKVNNPAFTKNYRIRKAFQLEYTVDGKKIVLSSPVNVKIKIDKALLNQNIQLAYIAKDGKVTFIDMKKLDDAIAFATAGSGNFVIVTKTDKQTGQSVNTGDTTTSAIFIGICLLSGAFLIIIRKQKQKGKRRVS